MSLTLREYPLRSPACGPCHRLVWRHRDKSNQRKEAQLLPAQVPKTIKFSQPINAHCTDSSPVQCPVLPNKKHRRPLGRQHLRSHLFFGRKFTQHVIDQPIRLCGLPNAHAHPRKIRRPQFALNRPQPIVPTATARTPKAQPPPPPNAHRQPPPAYRPPPPQNTAQFAPQPTRYCSYTSAA